MARELASDLLVATAALEITVHGWDVGQALGAGPRIPEELAERLLPVARQVVDDADRGVRFSPPHTLLVASRRPTSGFWPFWAVPDWSTGPFPVDSRRAEPREFLGFSPCSPTS